MSIPWNKGKKAPQISKAKTGKKRPDMVGNAWNVGKTPWNKGKKGTQTRNRMTFKKGMVPWNKGKRYEKVAGEKNWQWKGTTKLFGLVRKSFRYRQWRSDVFTRDDFTCNSCQDRGGILNAHHLKPFSVIMDENKIKTIEEALSCEELWNINNGITLCLSCHIKKDMHKGIPQRKRST